MVKKLLKDRRMAVLATLSLVMILFAGCDNSEKELPRVYVVGDNTVQAEPQRRVRTPQQRPGPQATQGQRQQGEQVQRPQQPPQPVGWGKYFVLGLDGGKVSTRTSGGRANSRTFTNGQLRNILGAANPGDVMLIQFGQYENLSPEGDPVQRIGGSLPGTGTETMIVENQRNNSRDTVNTYGWYLRKMVREARAKKMIPVIASPVPENVWENGKIKRSETYAKWAEEIAAAEGVEFIDLNKIVASEYDKLGEEKTTKLFIDGSTVNMTDNGAYFVAGIVYNAAAQTKALGKYVSEKYPTMEEMPEIEKVRNSRPPVTPNLQQDASHIKKPYKAQDKQSAKQVEKLSRGLVAFKQEDGSVFVSWRMFGTDPSDIAFNLYRTTDGGMPVRLNSAPVNKVTWFLDTELDGAKNNEWFVKPILDGKEQAASKLFAIEADAPAKNYLSIPLQTLEGHNPGDASIADLDGDGEYEIILKQEMRGYDNAHAGARRGTTKLEAYKLDGTFMWRIDLGPNIREGAHYTQFMVYDFDGDGKAEIICKTGEGTVDGEGNVITDAEGNVNDYANPDTGYILDGPEYFSVFDGVTGKELARENFIERGPKEDWPKTWGDTYGNRIDRYLSGVAYLDGQRPSVVLCRGYYGRAVVEAWNWRDGKLTRLWRFDTDDGNKANKAYRGQGAHSLSIADVDGDGKDEIIYGAAAIDNDGKGLYTTGLGHGDALHVSDFDPDRPGLELFMVHEPYPNTHGGEFRDARTGESIWGIHSEHDVGRGVAADIDPRYRGAEMWGAGLGGLYNVKGEKISDKSPASMNFLIYWDGDLLRELLDRNNVQKWDWDNEKTDVIFRAEDCRSNNGTKATPTVSADIFGDWREEFILCTTDNRELRIFSTTIPTDYRFYTFMHDPMYRVAIAWQNTAYNQPPHLSFYLGDGVQPKANVYYPKK